MLVVMVGRNFEKMLVDNSVLLITELGLGLSSSMMLLKLTATFLTCNF